MIKKFLVFMVIFLLYCTIIIAAQELTLPSARTNIEGKVEEVIVSQAAMMHGRVLWGNVSESPLIPLADLEGNIVAYEISFSVKHAEFASYREIMELVCQGRALVEEGRKWGDKSSLNKGSRLAWGIDTYRTMIVAARYDMYPILEYSTGLSRFYTTGDLAKERAARYLGTTDITLNRMYFAGHLDRWFEFTANNGRKILVDIYSLEAYKPEDILIRQPEKTKVTEASNFIQLHNRDAWRRIKSGIRIINQQGAERRIEGLPYFDWSYGCGPTSAAMILAYYDARGYPDLIDYYFDRWDPVEEEWDYNVPNVQEELSIAFRTNLATGYVWPWDIPPGIMHVTNDINGYHFYSYISPIGERENNFNWNLIRSEIDAGRPFIWGVYDYYLAYARRYTHHYVAAIGYTEDNYVINHNTWDTRDHYWYYYTNFGGRVSMTSVIPIMLVKRITIKP